MSESAAIRKMLLRRPVTLSEPPKAPLEYVEELRSEMALEAESESQSQHERSEELWNA